MPASSEMHGRHQPEPTGLSDYCTTDAWKGDLETGLFELDTVSRQMFGLGNDCAHGLLTLIQCFDRSDQHRLLDLFERAAASEMRFSFSTTVASKGAAGQPVFCVGRSAAPGESGNADLSGVFIFPHR